MWNSALWSFITLAHLVVGTRASSQPEDAQAAPDEAGPSQDPNPSDVPVSSVPADYEYLRQRVAFFDAQFARSAAPEDGAERSRKLADRLVQQTGTVLTNAKKYSGARGQNSLSVQDWVRDFEDCVQTVEGMVLATYEPKQLVSMAMLLLTDDAKMFTTSMLKDEPEARNDWILFKNRLLEHYDNPLVSL